MLPLATSGLTGDRPCVELATVKAFPYQVPVAVNCEPERLRRSRQTVVRRNAKGRLMRTATCLVGATLATLVVAATPQVASARTSELVTAARRTATLTRQYAHLLYGVQRIDVVRCRYYSDGGQFVKRTTSNVLCEAYAVASETNVGVCDESEAFGFRNEWGLLMSPPVNDPVIPTSEFPDQCLSTDADSSMTTAQAIDQIESAWRDAKSYRFGWTSVD